VGGAIRAALADGSVRLSGNGGGYTMLGLSETLVLACACTILAHMAELWLGVLDHIATTHYGRQVSRGACSRPTGVRHDHRWP